MERSLVPAAAGKIVICTSTCDPDRLAALGARVAKQLRFLEAPVSGTSAQVRQGDGVGLIGGDASIAQAAAPILDTLFPRRFHIGKIGDGGRAKLAVNLILGLNRLALAEGLVFAERLGLDENAFLHVARLSAAASQVMDTKGPKMVARDFAPEGRVRQTLKDAIAAPRPDQQVNVAAYHLADAGDEFTDQPRPAPRLSAELSRPSSSARTALACTSGSFAKFVAIRRAMQALIAIANEVIS